MAVEPEFADASDSDWGVSHAVELEEPAGFDLQVAASEVARVRNALAQRREARALERLVPILMDQDHKEFEVVVVNDKFGIRLTDVVTPSERLRRVSKS